MTYFTVSEIKQANRAAGKHFFDPATMRFFRSRILRGVIGGKYFVTSEQFDANSPRLYTLHEATPEGDIRTVGDFQAYTYPYQARNAAKRLARESS